MIKHKFTVVAETYQEAIDRVEDIPAENIKAGDTCLITFKDEEGKEKSIVLEFTNNYVMS